MDINVWSVYWQGEWNRQKQHCHTKQSQWMWKVENLQTRSNPPTHPPQKSNRNHSKYTLLFIVIISKQLEKTCNMQHIIAYKIAYPKWLRVWGICKTKKTKQILTSTKTSNTEYLTIKEYPWYSNWNNLCNWSYPINYSVSCNNITVHGRKVLNC